MMLGQLVQNQAMSLFMFTLPDLGGGGGVPSLFHLGDKEADIPAKALAVRRLGTELITMAGGQFIHPIRAVVGGVSAGLSRTVSEAMHDRVAEVLPVAIDLLERYWDLFEQLRQRIGTLGDDQPTHAIGAIEQGHAFYGGPIVVLDAETQERISFDAREYEQFLERVPIETSYSSATQFRGAPMHANSLARLNLVQRPGTPIADRYAERFWDTWSWPAYAILLYDIARGIELVYSLERAQSILEKDLSHDEMVVQGCDLPDGDGYGLVEAPRGPLIHHYRIQKGLVREATFVIPTQHNILAIERALEVAARRYIDEERISTELERAVGRVVRAFDPCIACATH
jgi:coenzyme F420-reducing hydrogenase alpha subunit